MEQRAHLGPVEVHEVDPPHPGPLPQRLDAGREAASRPHGGHQEHQVGVDELGHERGRRDVEQVEVVDEQHQRAPAALVLQHGPQLGHDRHQVDPLGADARRQQVGQRPQRRRLGPLGGRGPGHVAAVLVGEGQALVGQAGLAHPGRAVDHEAVGPGVAEAGGEQVELLVPPDQRPLEGAGGEGSPVIRDSRLPRPEGGGTRRGAGGTGERRSGSNFGGHPFTLDHLTGYARRAAELGFARWPPTIISSSRSPGWTAPRPSPR